MPSFFNFASFKISTFNPNFESFFISSVYLFGFKTFGGSETKSLLKNTPSLIAS